MAFKTMIGSLAMALLLMHGLPPAPEPERKSGECLLPLQAPIHWLRPLRDAHGMQYAFGILR